MCVGKRELFDEKKVDNLFRRSPCLSNSMFVISCYIFWNSRLCYDIQWAHGCQDLAASTHRQLYLTSTPLPLVHDEEEVVVSKNPRGIITFFLPPCRSLDLAVRLECTVIFYA
jgi:hypothetical protein